MTTTIIAKRTFTRTMANGHLLTATAKLYHIKGNSRPHFSVTAEERNTRTRRFDDQIVAWGAMHDEIARYFPKLRPILAMHGSDDTGAPIHAEENGWYIMAGALGGAMEQYHASNSDRHHPKPWYAIDPASRWNATDYRKPTADECLHFWADHVRINYAEALDIKLDIISHIRSRADAIEACNRQWDTAFGPAIYKRPFDGDPGENAANRIMRTAFAPCRERHKQIIASFADRWQAEANAALAFLREGDASND